MGTVYRLSNQLGMVYIGSTTDSVKQTLDDLLVKLNDWKLGRGQWHPVFAIIADVHKVQVLEKVKDRLQLKVREIRYKAIEQECSHNIIFDSFTTNLESNICEQCGQSFATAKCLRRHIARRHIVATGRSLVDVREAMPIAIPPLNFVHVAKEYRSRGCIFCIWHNEVECFVGQHLSSICKFLNKFNLNVKASGMADLCNAKRDDYKGWFVCRFGLDDLTQLNNTVRHFRYMTVITVQPENWQVE